MVERLMRHRTIRRRLPGEFGRTPFIASPDAELKYLRPGAIALHGQLLDVVRTFVTDDSQVWDIGANVGVFTFAAASRARSGGVLAVEADIWLAQLLRRSAGLRQNVQLPVSVLAAAVSDRVGIARFLIAARGRASNSLESAGGRSQMGGARDCVHVPTVTLDALLEHFPAPDVVKIDVEGAEVSVLEGGSRLLSEIRPILHIEVGAKQRAGATALLLRHRYRLHDGIAEAPLKSCVFNTLALPEERADALPARLRKAGEGPG